MARLSLPIRRTCEPRRHRPRHGTTPRPDRYSVATSWSSTPRMRSWPAPARQHHVRHHHVRRGGPTGTGHAVGQRLHAADYARRLIPDRITGSTRAPPTNAVGGRCCSWRAVTRSARPSARRSSPDCNEHALGRNRSAAHHRRHAQDPRAREDRSAHRNKPGPQTRPAPATPPGQASPMNWAVSNVALLALTIPERETIIRARVDAPPGLEELRAVLLREHVGRVRDGLARRLPR